VSAGCPRCGATLIRGRCIFCEQRELELMERRELERVAEERWRKVKERGSK
jgi:hypothetical protein